MLQLAQQRLIHLKIKYFFPGNRQRANVEALFGGGGVFSSLPGVGGGGELLPYMGYIGMCGPKGYGFSAVLDINRVCFLYPNLDMGMILSRDKAVA